MPRLRDGTVLPSIVGVSTTRRDHSVQRMLNQNFVLREGTVTRRYGPTSKDNISKRAWEYDVEVVLGSIGQAPTRVPYPHCVCAAGYGGDKIERTIKVGSPVYLLCLNGRAGTAVIVGGVSQAGADEDAYEFTYNGMTFAVGADSKVTLTTPNASTTIDPAGNVSVEGERIQAKDSSGQEITLDPIARMVTIKGQAAINVEATGPVKIQAPGITLAGAVAVSGALSVAPPGGGGTPSPMVKGDKIAQALQELVEVFTDNAASLTVGANPGSPAALSPGVAASLAQWIVRWVASGRMVDPRNTTAS